MKIKELYNKIQEHEFFIEELKGDLTLNGNCIVWTFDIKNSEDYHESTTINDDDDDEYCFNITSPSEILQDAYDVDIIAIENLVEEIDESSEWSYSLPEVSETTISFKIF
jgi:hypothetical protein